AVAASESRALSLRRPAVDLTGDVLRDEALLDVLGDAGRIPFAGVSVPAAAGRLDQHLVAAPQQDVRELRRRDGAEGLGERAELRFARALDEDRRRAALPAAVEAVGAEARLRPVEERVHGDLRALLDPHDAPRPEPSAHPARAAGVVDERVLEDAQRIPRLEDL